MKVLKFEGTPLSQREILIARAAYVNGAATFSLSPEYIRRAGAAAAAESEYPLPKTTRPRLIQRGGTWYRVNGDGRLESQPPCHAGCAGPHSLSWETCETIPADYAVAIADLIANPTEEVDA